MPKEHVGAPLRRVHVALHQFQKGDKLLPFPLGVKEHPRVASTARACFFRAPCAKRGVVAMKETETKISRRGLLAGGLVAGAAPLVGAASAQAAAKIEKSAVRFNVAASVPGHTCGTCKMFKAPSACMFVDGEVSQDCSCWIWSGKTG
jgi:hypothetical protein